MLLFRLVRWARVILAWFFGNKYEEEFRLFRLEKVNEEDIYDRLIPYCYQYNYMGAVYREQVFQVRQLTDLLHQIHLRFYKDGWVTGHYELQPEMYPMTHLRGEGLRELTLGERAVIELILAVKDV